MPENIPLDPLVRPLALRVAESIDELSEAEMLEHRRRLSGLTKDQAYRAATHLVTLGQQLIRDVGEEALPVINQLHELATHANGEQKGEAFEHDVLNVQRIVGAPPVRAPRAKSPGGSLAPVKKGLVKKGLRGK